MQHATTSPKTRGEMPRSDVSKIPPSTFVLVSRLHCHMAFHSMHRSLTSPSIRKTNINLHTKFNPAQLSRRTMTSTIPPFARDFPGSTASPSQTFHWPGVTAESTSTVRKVLEENDRKYDIYEKVRCKPNLHQCRSVSSFRHHLHLIRLPTIRSRVVFRSRS